MEEQGAGGEGYQHVAAPYHRDDGYHRVGEAQGIEVYPVRQADEYRDEDDIPPPDERRRLFPPRIPEEQQDEQHDAALIDIEPHLHGHHVQPLHQVFVIQSAARPEQDREHRQRNPFIMCEVYPFLFPRKREQVERCDGKGDTHPLIEVQPFAEDEERPQQRQHRLRRLDGPGQRQGQMFQGKVSRYPRREDDDGLDEYRQVCLCRDTGHVEHRPVQRVGIERQQDEGQKD